MQIILLFRTYRRRQTFVDDAYKPTADQTPALGRLFRIDARRRWARRLSYKSNLRWYVSPHWIANITVSRGAPLGTPNSFWTPNAGSVVMPGYLLSISTRT